MNVGCNCPDWLHAVSVGDIWAAAMSYYYITGERLLHRIYFCPFCGKDVRSSGEMDREYSTVQMDRREFREPCDYTVKELLAKINPPPDDEIPNESVPVVIDRSEEADDA